MRVCVECSADLTLVRALGFRDVVHGGNKSKVTKYVREHDDVVGLVDEDPGTIVSRDLRAFLSSRKPMTCRSWSGGTGG